MRDGRHHEGRSGSVAGVAPDPDVGEEGDAAAAFDALRAEVETLSGQLTTIGRGVGAVLDQLEGAAPHDVGVPTQPVVVTRASTGRVPA